MGHIIAVIKTNIQTTPNPNNITTKYEKINLNDRPSYLGNVLPKRKSGREPGTSFGNKIRIFTDNIYIQNKANLIYIHL